MINFNIFKGGTRHIVTMSYDDCNLADIKLVELFNKYGIKGTFNVNTNGNETKVQPSEFKKLYEGHEVAVHTVNHPYMELLPKSSILSEVLENRKTIENAVGYTARGMAYPFGTYNDEIIDILKSCGICYSRTVESTDKFIFPRDFMKWHPTCHHNDALGLCDRFVGDIEIPWRCDLFYIWGHSFELKTAEDWENMENILKKISGHKSVWYATNIEIYDYVTAQKALCFAADESFVYNPSAIEVWFEADGKVLSVKPGETKVI